MGVICGHVTLGLRQTNRHARFFSGPNLTMKVNPFGGDEAEGEHYYPKCHKPSDSDAH